MKWLKRLIWRFKLWRAPTIIGYDPGGEDFGCTVTGKSVNGTLIITDIKYEEAP